LNKHNVSSQLIALLEGNAVQIDGQMIDEPVYQQALATLAKLPT